MKRKQLNLTNTLLKFDSQFTHNLNQILPNISNDLSNCDTSIFDKDIECFIKKYGENNYSSIDALLNYNKQESYFEDDCETSLSDTINSLFPK